MTKPRPLLCVTLALAIQCTGLATADAAVLASAVLLSTDAQRLDCFVSNVGTRPVEVATVSIANGGGTLLSLADDSCTGTLSPGASCLFSAALDARFSARGTVEVRGSAKGLRGQCQLSASSRLVATTELRD